MHSHHPVWLLLLFTASPSSVLASDGSDNECDPLDNYRFRLTQSLKTFDTRRMSAWSGGGGPIWQLESDTGNPFAGRNYGSGDRRTIYGSRAYGSGYPTWSYPVLDPTTVAGRGFPYGVWPIPWAGNYSGSTEYGAETAELFRPGGQVVQAPLRPTRASGNSTSAEEETYWLIGDRGSTLSILTNMVDWCHAEPIWPEIFEAANDGTGVAGNYTGQGVRFHPGNVLQYYRASTFALAHPRYNNTYAYPPLNTTTLLTHDQSTPINDVMKSSAWLWCINVTIADALPILDMPPNDRDKIILGIVLSSIFLGPCVLWWMYACFHCMCSGVMAQVRRTRVERRAIVKRRTEVDEFQLYP